jgi:alpha-ketoglutarate-dependent taurine dioxygenase
MAKVHPGPRPVQPTYAAEERKAYRRIVPEPMSPTIGAEIGGVSLRQPIDEATFDELHRALLEYKVIFFRDQDITPEQHVAFARRFGELETHPFVPHRDGHPEVMVLRKNDKMRGYENVWHSDVTWRQEPSLGSVLLAREVPPIGGDTLFCDMYAAYDGLSERMRGSKDCARCMTLPARSPRCSAPRIWPRSRRSSRRRSTRSCAPIPKRDARASTSTPRSPRTSSA